MNGSDIKDERAEPRLFNWRGRFRQWLLPVGILALMAATIPLWSPLFFPRSLHATDFMRIVILPFENATGDPMFS
ncbi:MAG: hypothetical protein QHI48_11770, partial [Bacteroidota bacterium]|nr:hypothetical protein [Bacteroidota bacterium]